MQLTRHTFCLLVCLFCSFDVKFRFSLPYFDIFISMKNGFKWISFKSSAIVEIDRSAKMLTNIDNTFYLPARNIARLRCQIFLEKELKIKDDDPSSPPIMVKPRELQCFTNIPENGPVLIRKHKKGNQLTTFDSLQSFKRSQQHLIHCRVFKRSQVF